MNATCTITRPVAIDAAARALTMTVTESMTGSPVVTFTMSAEPHGSTGHTAPRISMVLEEDERLAIVGFLLACAPAE